MAGILLVDADVVQLELARRVLAGNGYRPFTATTADDAVDLLRRHETDVVICDPALSPDEDRSLIGYVGAEYPDTSAIVITENASIAGAVAAIKAGAGDYLEKPLSPEHLLRAVRESLRKVAARRRLRADPPIDGGGLQWGYVGDSPPMKGLYAKILKVGATDAPVLIQGETGTGKQLAAGAIHRESRRASAPFLAINCAELAPDLLESELFGHVHGAFTGADRDRRGVFRAADGGTLFLDEIAEMSPVLQAKVLRVVDEGVVRPVGTTKEYRVDVRIVAATHRDLGQLVKKKRFREDLLYRILVFALELPPLRERGNDVLLLAHHFHSRYTGTDESLRLSDGTIETLLTYRWPGNVRELANVMQQVAVMADGREIVVADLPAGMLSRAEVNGGPVLTRRTLAQVEEVRIREEFAAQNGNQSATAKILGISRETLRLKLRRFGLID